MAGGARRARPSGQVASPRRDASAAAALALAVLSLLPVPWMLADGTETAFRWFLVVGPLAAVAGIAKAVAWLRRQRPERPQPAGEVMVALALLLALVALLLSAWGWVGMWPCLAFNDACA